MAETLKQAPFDTSIKKTIIGAVKNGLVIQVQDAPIEDYVVFDLKTKQQILKLRENYVTVFSSLVFKDNHYMTKDAHYMINGVIGLRKNAQSPDKAHYIPESDFEDIYKLIKTVAVKVR